MKLEKALRLKALNGAAVQIILRMEWELLKIFLIQELKIELI